MTDKQEIYDRINELLQSPDPAYDSRDAEQLEEFIDNVENQQYSEFDEIEKLYTELMEISFYDDDD